MRIHGEEPHPVLRPQVARDSNSDSSLQAAHQEIARVHLPFSTKEFELTIHRLCARQRVAETSLAQLEHPSEHLPELLVLGHGLAPPTFRDPPCTETVQLSTLPKKISNYMQIVLKLFWGGR